jgi:hypothetical protein
MGVSDDGHPLSTRGRKPIASVHRTQQPWPCAMPSGELDGTACTVLPMQASAYEMASHAIMVWYGPRHLSCRYGS